ncbi:alpha/beta fold hydrolase [Mangrovibrevibacter kandeliae]|uniref:alpha/beta fold hydrolase n=1 Tax=Mangrovibrevibacter kandeliae TaxID=2968473 RepID=UPI0021197971|nr:alpha/beta fold hydrolase [Aurantimonas sp. CSK15Z-1]MCQ8781897.1 alpha/beta fold hydrolase [Aurantimonas sp. CSK15Z-1]
MARETTVAVPGTEIFCRIDGAGADAPWIVFSNSLVTDLTIWDAQVEALQDRFRILRYDQRGHGRTPPGASAPDLPRLGADLHAVLDHVGIDRCSFVGLSMGVPTGLAAYGARPARFERLVLSDGQAKTAPTGAATWAGRIAYARENGMDGYAADTAQRWLQPEAAAGPKGERLRAMVAATPLEGFVHGATALQSYDHVADVARITCPLLVIAGAEDGAMPKSMRASFGDVPGVAVEIIDGAGHVPNFEQPEAFNAALRHFLDR